MQNPRRVMTAISRLLSPFPATAQGEGDEVLRRYIEAVDEYDDGDIEAGCTLLNKGKVPGANMNYAPTPPIFATAVRMAMEQRLSNQPPRVALPEPILDISPEQRAKGKAILDQLAAELGAKMRTDEAEQDRRRNERAGRVNARFAPDMSQDATARRLGIGSVGYTVGDADADEGDMGQRAVS